MGAGTQVLFLENQLSVVSKLASGDNLEGPEEWHQSGASITAWQGLYLRSYLPAEVKTKELGSKALLVLTGEQGRAVKMNVMSTGCMGTASVLLPAHQALILLGGSDERLWGLCCAAAKGRAMQNLASESGVLSYPQVRAPTVPNEPSQLQGFGKPRALQGKKCCCHRS